MYDKGSTTAVKFGIAAAMSAASLIALSGCEERPYPAQMHAEAPAAKPTAALMGAPSPYTAPPVVQQPTPAPVAASTPVAYAPPPATYTASVQAYDAGSVVAMAPIPNPGDPGSSGYYDGHAHTGRIHARYDAGAPAAVVAENTVTSPYGEGHPAPGRHPTYAYTAPAPKSVAPVYTPPVYTPKSPPPASVKPTAPVYAKATPPAYKPPVVKAPVYTPPKPVTYAKTTTTTTTTVAKTTTSTSAKAPPVVVADAKKIEHKGAAIAVAAGAAAGVMAMDAKHAAVQAKQAAVTAYVAKTTPPSAPKLSSAAAATTQPPSADRATNLASLQTTLTDTVGKTAILTAPASFTANQPVDVSLTIPAAFADTLRTTAQKDGLGDAAASVNMTAILSGDGFSVTPDDTQSVPLAVGQPTKFVWTVTAQPGAKGPLHADVGADLLGGGSDKLALGSVQKAAGMGIKLTPRVIGASLLVLIAALVVAWLARGRGPTRPASARRASRRAARGGRPLDMSADVGAAEEAPAH
jgi:hypothetical protein